MQEEVNMLYEIAQESMSSTVSHLNSELTKIRTGKASAAMVSGISVDYYGSQTPLSQVANVGTSDAKTITIQPWEKSLIPVIEKAIFEANLGLTPQNDGEMVRLVVPPLTEERRRDLVKKAKALGEDAKVGVRGARQKAMDGIKKAVKDGYPEDAGKRAEHNVQEFTNSFGKKIDDILTKKEADIMTV